MRGGLAPAAVVIAVGVLATTLSQTEVLARLPLQNLLKNALHLDRSGNAAFFFWAGLAWYLKPLFGVVTDAFPLLGSRRRGYLVIGSVLAAAGWLTMAFTPLQFGALLAVAIGLNVFMVVCSTVIGATMVETAQAIGGSGRLTALRQSVQQGCAIINGPVSGTLASVAFGYTCLACGGIVALLAPVALLCLREERTPVVASVVLANARTQLRRIAAARTMWAAAGLMALFYLAPGFATAMFYRQQNDLHFTPVMQGWLGLISGVCGVAAALTYAALCRRVRLRWLLMLCMGLGTAANLGYLFYGSWQSAQVIDGLNGFGYTLAELALMDLAVRATPAGSEGLGFALMVSVRNFALFGTDWFGAKLLDAYGVPFDWLVLANSVTTAVTVPLVLLLPAAVVALRDSEGVGIGDGAMVGLADAKERSPL